MNSLMEYKGYHAKIEFSAEDSIFFGRIIGINDVIVFDGENVSELETMFHESVDDYIAMCEEMGVAPDKEYKGTFNIRVTPDLHKRAALAAEDQGITLNQLVVNSIENELSGKHIKEKESSTIILPMEIIKEYSVTPAKNDFSDRFAKESVDVPCKTIITNLSTFGS